MSATPIFSREYAPEIFAELKPLTEKHYKEVFHFQDIPIDVCWDEYAAAEEMDLLRVFTVRLSDELIGYAIFFVRHGNHSSSVRFAIQDSIFISPVYRGFGAKFVKWCDEQLEIDGVDIVHHNVTEACDFRGMLERSGYELVNWIYAKRLRGYS